MEETLQSKIAKIEYVVGMKADKIYVTNILKIKPDLGLIVLREDKSSTLDKQYEYVIDCVLDVIEQEPSQTK